MAVGLVVHRLAFRRLTRTSPNLDVFEARGLMVSFGLMFLVQNFAQLVWGGDLRGYDFLADPVPVGGAQFAGNKLLLFVLALAISRRADRRAAAHAAGQGRARADAVARPARAWSASTPNGCTR